MTLGFIPVLIINLLLNHKVDPLVSLMMVEKVPDSTYEMVGGLDKQIKEIKEVCYCINLVFLLTHMIQSIFIHNKHT